MCFVLLGIINLFNLFFFDPSDFTHILQFSRVFFIFYRICYFISKIVYHDKKFQQSILFIYQIDFCKPKISKFYSTDVCNIISVYMMVFQITCTLYIFCFHVITLCYGFGNWNSDTNRCTFRYMLYIIIT